MKHPTPEEWMEYLYQETPSPARTVLTQHLRECESCRAQMTAWRGVGQALHEWKVAPQRSARWSEQTWLKWAAAAVIVLGLGLLSGRVMNPGRTDLKALQAELRQQLRAELQADWQAAFQAARQDLAAQMRQQNQAEWNRVSSALAASTDEQTRHLLAEFLTEYEDQRQQEYNTVISALRRLETQRVQDNTVLRADLETLAVTAAAEFQQARNQIGQLATFTQQPSGKSNQP
jgi:hypothetical protein